MINLKTGELIASKDLVFKPGYTFEEFSRSKYYDNQDAIKAIYLKNIFEIDSHKYLIHFFFRNKIIYAVSLVCVDVDFSYKDEVERKLLHDKILNQNNIQVKNQYIWGSIQSEFDQRSNCSEILVIYN